MTRCGLRGIHFSFAAVLVVFIISLHSGLSAALARQAVYGTARIGLHRKISNDFIAANNNQPLSFSMKALAGMISGSIAVCIGKFY